jgi:xylan 1,4-beta-xylosidase
VPAEVRGDGAGATVEALATRDEDSAALDVLVWNGTLDQSKIDGAPALDRTVTVEVTGLPPGARYDVASRQVDESHGNIRRVWKDLGGGDWPDAAQWKTLRAADTLPTAVLEPVTAGADGTAAVTVTVPMPGIRLLRLARR